MNEHQHRLLEQAINAQTWTDFQRMVHELARAERPNAIPLEAPDGGADTLIPASGAEPKEVVQAKHFPKPKSIRWPNCIASLDEAIETHDPGRVTFAFPRDFTEKQERAFREKLVDRYPDVDVRPWLLTDIIAELDRHPEIKKRYFGREQHEEQVDSFLRAVKHGGKLDTGADLIEQAHSLAAFADEHDRDFEYGVTGTGATMREPKWDELPFITLTIGDEKATVHVNAWTREGAEVPLPGFSFTDDEAGRAAKEFAREELASGRDAVLRSGVRVQIPNAPKVLRETTDGNSMEMEEIKMCFSDATAVGVEIETDDETVERTFPLRWVPPHEAGHVAYACREGAIWIELDFEPLEEPTVRFGFKLTGTFADDVSMNLAAARLLDAFFRQKRIVLRAEHFFPGGELENRGATGSEADRQSVAARVRLYGALAFIEERTGAEFVLPENITHEDVQIVGTIVNILETGGGTARFENVKCVVPPQEIAALDDNTRGPRLMRRPVLHELFGQIVNLGIGEYEIPPVRVIDVKPLGTKPDAPAHVTLGPEGNDQTPFRLIESVQAA